MARPTKQQQINKKIGEGVSKMTPERIKMLKDAFAIDATIEEASFYCGINEQTYYNWKKKNPKLFEEIERLRLKPILYARKVVIGSLNNPENSKWYLERKRRGEFSQRFELENNIKIIDKVEDATQFINEMLDEYKEDK